jgi:hypothetical protein
MEVCMNVWRVIQVSCLLLISAQADAEKYLPYIDKSIDLISGSINCSGWEENDYKDFYVYAGFSTINVSGDICHTAVPNVPASCDGAQVALAEFFAATGTCLYWRAQPPSMSAEFMCKGSRPQLIRIYYDLCGFMHEIGTE